MQLSRQYQADKIVLFGSRTRGDHRENSDIDIAVFGMPAENQALFWDSVNELPTLLEFDIVFLSPKTDEKLVRNIEKDGVILMDKFAEKYEKLQSCLLYTSKPVSHLNSQEEYRCSMLCLVFNRSFQMFVLHLRIAAAVCDRLEHVRCNFPITFSLCFLL